MRKGILAAGAVVLVLGIVVFVVCVVVVSQASTNFLSCLNGSPNPPVGFPTACTDAMSSMFLYGTLEWLGIILAVVGTIVLIIGFFLEPERPAFAPPYYAPQMYAPQMYAPPPVYQPPKGPQTPPPQP